MIIQQLPSKNASEVKDRLDKQRSPKTEDEERKIFAQNNNTYENKQTIRKNQKRSGKYQTQEHTAKEAIVRLDRPSLRKTSAVT